MKDTNNLLAALLAFCLALGLGWYAWSVTRQTDEIVEPVFVPEPPAYRLGWRLLSPWLEQPPAVVSSKRLPPELRNSMARQNQLLVIVTGLGAAETGEASFQKRLDLLRSSFPQAVDSRWWRSDHVRQAGAQTWHSEATRTYVYNYSHQIRSTNTELINDFRHTVRNATLDDLDYVVNNIRFKIDSWNSRLSHHRSTTHGPMYAQASADRGFLKNMTAYLRDWIEFRTQWNDFQKENPDLERARTQWAHFEQSELPVLNNYITGHVKKTFTPNEDGAFRADISPSDVLYARVVIASRTLHLPLRPADDPRLGLTLVALD